MDFDASSDDDDDDDDECEDMIEQFEPQNDARNSQPDRRPPSSINLFQVVQEMVADASKRADLSESNVSNEYKLNQEKIKQCLQDLLDGVGGPDGSIEDKLNQLYMHSSLHASYEMGEMPKCLMSFYLYKMQRQRKVHISQLEAAQWQSRTKKDLNWTAQRLEKCPSGMCV